jgi:hypothetical protein
MPRLLEKNLISRINRRLPRSIHHQSMTFGSQSFNGTPDRYYDGSRRDLWVEYKQLKTAPRSGIAVGEYSELQIMWMERRYKRGKNVVGMVGTSSGLVCIQTTPEQWRDGSPLSSAVSVEDAAKWIEDFCGP